VTIGLFEATEAIRQALAKSLIEIIAQIWFKEKKLLLMSKMKDPISMQ